MCQRCGLLEIKIAKLEHEINRLRLKINSAVIYCDQQQKASGAVISQKSGVKPGKWHWHKGAQRVSGIVLRIFVY